MSEFSGILVGRHEPAPADALKERPPLGPLFWICMGWVALNVVVAIFANVLPLQDPNFQNYALIDAGPSLHHLFGTDDIGRDIFARVVFGSRISLSVGVGSMIIGFGIGAPLGMLSAYRRGRLDAIVTAVMYGLLAFPSIVATIAVLSFWTPRDLFKIIVVIGVASIPIIYRLVRATTLSVASRDFVIAAKVQGASDWRILFKELLPNVSAILISFLLIGVATVVTVEATLALLGLSVNPPTPSWGNMINEARTVMAQNPWLVIFPSLALCLFLLSLNFIGDRLRKHYDVTEVKL